MGPIQLGRAEYYLPELMQARPLLPYSTCTEYYNILLFFFFFQAWQIRTLATLLGLTNLDIVVKEAWLCMFHQHFSTIYEEIFNENVRKDESEPPQKYFFVGILFSMATVRRAASYFPK